MNEAQLAPFHETCFFVLYVLTSCLIRVNTVSIFAHMERFV